MMELNKVVEERIRFSTDYTTKQVKRKAEMLVILLDGLVW